MSSLNLVYKITSPESSGPGTMNDFAQQLKDPTFQQNAANSGNRIWLDFSEYPADTVSFNTVGIPDTTLPWAIMLGLGTQRTIALEGEWQCSNPNTTLATNSNFIIKTASPEFVGKVQANDKTLTLVGRPFLNARIQSVGGTIQTSSGGAQ